MRALGSPMCAPPEAAVAQLRAYFAYQNSFFRNRSVQQRFSVLRIGDQVFFRHNNPPPYTDPSLSPIYIYRPGHRIDTNNCPTGPGWVNCVADLARNPGRPDGPACEFTLEVPAWKPSPDNELKQKLASEILQEIQAFGGSSGTKAIYIRDFNVDDPEIEAYIINTTAEPEFLGCSLDAAKSPHCEWHGFGQAPVASLRRQIMSRPYRLYPPPMGKP